MKNKKKRILIVLYALALTFALLFAYLYFNGRSGMHPNPQPKDGDIRVACVGDSITYGSTVKNWPANNYPILLDNLLGDGYCANNYGISGGALLSSTDKPYCDTEVYADSIAFLPDIVVIMLGTNDSKANNWTYSADFAAQLNALIDTYEALSTAPQIILCTPCKAYSDAFSIQETEILQIVDVVRSVATQRNLCLVDIRTLSELHPEWFETDGIHPNNDGAAAIADAVYEAITDVSK